MSQGFQNYTNSGRIRILMLRGVYSRLTSPDEISELEIKDSGVFSEYTRVIANHNLDTIKVVERVGRWKEIFFLPLYSLHMIVD